jgi:hypothetical protein
VIVPDLMATTTPVHWSLAIVNHTDHTVLIRARSGPKPDFTVRLANRTVNPMLRILPFNGFGKIRLPRGQVPLVLKPGKTVISGLLEVTYEACGMDSAAPGEPQCRTLDGQTAMPYLASGRYRAVLVGWNGVPLPQASTPVRIR